MPGAGRQPARGPDGPWRQSSPCERPHALAAQGPTRQGDPIASAAFRTRPRARARPDAGKPRHLQVAPLMTSARLRKGRKVRGNGLSQAFCGCPCLGDCIEVPVSSHACSGRHSRPKILGPLPACSARLPTRNPYTDFEETSLPLRATIKAKISTTAYCFNLPTPLNSPFPYQSSKNNS